MLSKKVSFNDIISKNLVGCWCEGIAFIEVTNKEFCISNIYCPYRKGIGIDGYTIEKDEEIFSPVIKVTYSKAIKEFCENGKSIISPTATKEIVTFEGMKGIEYGGNVYCHSSKDNKIIVNDKHKFESFEEILSFGFISEDEQKGKWLVF